MSLSERIYKLEAEARRNGLNPPPLTFYTDTKHAYEELYAELPVWERYARTTAYGIAHLPVVIREGERIVGRYYLYDKDVNKDCSYVDDLTRSNMLAAIDRKHPEFFPDFSKYTIYGDFLTHGHVSYMFEQILHGGIEGLMEQCRRCLQTARDAEAAQFYQGVLILCEGILEWNDRHIQELEGRGLTELAEICRRVPRYPARTFHEALQCVNFVYFSVSRETASGTYGPGWLDYYLWPYLERDIAAGLCTMEDARELVAELFIHIDERLLAREPHNDTVITGGSYPNGMSAVNPLSYLMIEVVMDLSITCLLVYMKMPEHPPEAWTKLAAHYLTHSRNRGMVLNDRAIAGALERRGMPYAEALGYTSNGCMEITGPSNNSDLLFSGWHNIPKLLEFAVTGNRCLLTGNSLTSLRFKGLAAYGDFDAFYHDFMAELRRVLFIYFDGLDIMSEFAETYRPAYFASSMINDCMLRGRNMHGGGARYHDYGTAPLGMGNAADALIAIRKAVFEEKRCTAGELIRAMEANYEGYEPLRLALRAYPKYGQDNEEADAFTAKFMNDICDIYDSYVNRHGGRIKLVIMTFVWAYEAGRMIGATPDGNRAGTAVAQAVTPQSASMTKGITAAIKSNTRIPFDRFAGGASSMWDFDPSWINEELMESFIMTFVDLGGQMFQGNTSVNPDDLVKAQQSPQDYEHIIVRVGGFSARFNGLTRDVQDDIIDRCRHGA